MTVIRVLERRTEDLEVVARVVAAENPSSTEGFRWKPWILAGDLDDDGSEPHICRGID